jgi:hypothetical protein
MKIAFAFLTTFIANVVLAQDALIPKARSLTLQEFVAVVSTAVETDFE